MSNSAKKFSLWPQVWRLDRWRGHLLISAVFLLLLISVVVSLGRYWVNTLQPRLYANAETQANILAQSQAAVLLKTIEHSAQSELPAILFQVVQEMLLATDPAINARMVRGVTLLIDYDLVNLPQGSLDFSEGETECSRCFSLSMPLLNEAGDLLGVADFTISEYYYSLLSQEMKSKLYAESSLMLALLLVVWVTMLVMFDRLHRAKQLIEASDQAKTRFMANVTHELRTPLNAILGYTQLYKADPVLSSEYRKGIETIDRSAEHLLLLINDILDFSRTDQKGLRLHPAQIHLVTLLTTLQEIAQISAKLKGVSFISQFPAQLPSHVVADDKRLRQVLLNLLSNAIKFTERGQVTFKVQVLRQSTKYVSLRFSVQDTGIGIAKADLHKIFIPFHQLDNLITRAEGSGLGLTISQRIVRLMGSELKVDSSPDHGSTFWFDLKLESAGMPEILPQLPTQPEIEERRVLPAMAALEQLLENCRQHNVLAIRQQMKELAQDPKLEAFIAEIQPYISNYRYKQLAVWLEQLIGQAKE